MAELTHLIADYKNALRPGGGGTPQMNSLTRNGSHRSLRKPASASASASLLPHSSPSTLPHAHHAHHQHHQHQPHGAGHRTLHSHSHATSGTLGSERNATLTLSSHTSSLAHGQPDILKSTPDHHRADKKRAQAQDGAVA